MQAGFSVTLVESPDCSDHRRGRGHLADACAPRCEKMGVSETDFFRQCDAAFKQGARFARWTTGADDDGYYHPLMLPQGFAQVNLVPHWLAQDDRAQLLRCRDVRRAQLCDDGLAPKMITTPEYQAVANYAYHLDAGKFAPFLQKHCTEKLGVRHVLADVAKVNQAEKGDIRSVDTQQAGEIDGRSVRRLHRLSLPCCSARRSACRSRTAATCCSATPRWRCRCRMRRPTRPWRRTPSPPRSRRAGSGTSACRRGAASAMSIPAGTSPTRRPTRRCCATIGPQHKDLTARKISDPRRASRDLLEEQLRRGRARRGISRAAGILRHRADRTVGQADRRADAGQSRGDGHRRGALQRGDPLSLGPHHRFPQAALCADQAHGQRVLARQCRSGDDSGPAQESVALWKYQSPWFFDEFDRLEEVFPAASYQYVLYGMGFRTEVEPEDNAGTADLGHDNS